ncbi:MAG: YcaQ family DNA glycosylase [Armatimonadetes bacterium]|nr:YcaQ family DNA glycosylase [Anaerolineae bacterium]
MLTLTSAAARTALITAQSLNAHRPLPATQADVRAIIRQMHVLQIDTINIVARSPYLVLWSRLGAYDPRWLDALLAEGALFEYWSHAACFLPIEDYPLYRRQMLDAHHGAAEADSHSQQWLSAHPGVSETVLARIQTGGVVRSADFERTDGLKGTWWDWKVEKIALERLFNTGALMVRKRHNFQRYYDLRERVLPDYDDTQTPTRDAMLRAFVLNTVQALGVTQAAWVADYFRLSKVEALKTLKALVKTGEVLEVAVAGWNAPGYAHPAHLAMLQAAADDALPTAPTTLLSPFDPIVWDRARATAMFNFDYKIECYTPAPKRIYGYFTLPILHRNALIGRLDPKAHRADKVFEVKALHLEQDVELTDDIVEGLRDVITRCAAWHGTPEVVIRRTEPAALLSALQFS